MFVEYTDYYRVTTTPIAESIRPTAYGLTVDAGTLSFNDGIVQNVVINNIVNVANGADFDLNSRVGDTVNIAVKGVINDDTTTNKDFLVVIPCTVLKKSTVTDKVGTEFKDCVVAPSGREVLIEAVDNETNRVSYIVTPGYDSDRTMRVGQNTFVYLTFQKMV